MDELISRQAAIDAMNAKLEDIKLRWRGKVKKGEIAMYLDMRGTIETLPSAEPVRHGKWIIEDGHVCCSECGEISKEFNYCPYCGCRMDKE